jgi:hypothetical protein
VTTSCRRVLPINLSILLFAALARATVIVPVDLGELSRDAKAIARGRVSAVTGRWTDDRRTIETVVTLDVDRYLKGSFGSTIAFRVPGGVLGRYRSIVVGAPEFAVGDRVVVFLGANGPMVPFLVGFNQGVYRLLVAPDGSGWLVTPPPNLPSATVSTPVVRGDPSRRPQRLAEFEQRVVSLAKAAQ